MLRAVYTAFPALQQPKSAAAAAAASPPSAASPAAAPTGWRRVQAAAAAAAADQAAAWRVFLRQPFLLAALALALLYFTVLSLGYLMIAFLKSAGETEAVISAFRAVGAVAGLAATVSFPALHARLGLRLCGAVGVLYQLTWLAASVTPIIAHTAAPGAAAAAVPHGLLIFMLTGLAASRSGLWLFDLAVSQIMQQGALPDELGAVCGAQAAACSFFDILMFVACLGAHRPAQFPWLMAASLATVATAAAMYLVSCAGGGAGKQLQLPGDLEVAAAGRETDNAVLLAGHAPSSAPPASA